MMKALIVEDHFIKKEIVAEELTKAVGEEIQFNSLPTKWPLEPLKEGEEVHEYVGVPEKIAKHAAATDILVVHTAPVNKQVFAAGKKIKIVACMRGGPVNVNIKEATRRGIPVVNAPNRNAIAVAEYVVGMMLAEIRNIARAHSYLKKGEWRGEFYCLEKAGFELANKTLGIIGFGNIGRKVCELCSGLNMHVLVYDPYVESEEINKIGAHKTSLSKLLKQSHIISLHARYTEETKEMIGEREFDLIQPGTYLINTARGGLINQHALCTALKEGKIAGAALDTFDPEPPAEDSPLYDLENVTLTPHIAGASEEVARRSAQIVARDIARFFTNVPLKNCVNPEVFESTHGSG